MSTVYKEHKTFGLGASEVHKRSLENNHGLGTGDGQGDILWNLFISSFAFLSPLLQFFYPRDKIVKEKINIVNEEIKL